MVTINSTTKKLLIIIAVIMLCLSSFELIYACIYQDGQQIFWAVLNLIMDSVFVLVLIKQYQTGLKVYSIAYLTLAILSFIVLVILIFFMITGKEQNNHMSETLVSIVLGGILYSILAYLLNKYINQVNYNEGYVTA